MVSKAVKYGAIGFLFGGPFGAAIGAVLGHRGDVHGDLLEQIDSIRNDISAAREDPDKSAESKDLIGQWLQLKASTGKPLSEEAVDQVFNFLSAYVARTPDLMQGLFQAAKWSNLEAEIITIFRVAVSYFKDNDDLVRDDLGIAGLVDDAFVTQLLVQRLIASQGDILSAAVTQQIDLSAGNKLVADLLPSEIVDELTRRVDQAMSESEARQAMNRLLAQSAAIQSGWNTASKGIDWKREIVRDQIYSDLAKEGIFMRPG